MYSIKQHSLLYSVTIHTFSPSILERAIDVQVAGTFMFTEGHEVK